LSHSPWRILFFGTPTFAVPSLEAILEEQDEVVAVVTQPDREKGRGRKVIASPVKEAALRHGLAVVQPEKVKEEAFQKTVLELRPDLIIVVAYGRILPKSILEIPKRGAVNVHGSLLPVFRGSSPIAWAILKGEKITGVTTIMMDEGMDTGDILLQSEVPIQERETFETLHDRLALTGAQLLTKTIKKMKMGEIQPVPQDPSKATYAPLLKKEDGRIDWKKGAREIDRQVRAFTPWPGAYTEWSGRLLKIYSGEARESNGKGNPGTVAWAGSESIEVKAGSGSFLIKEVQIEGKKRMAVRDFLSGNPVPIGTVLG
jgi:methionyl-tRNA formyltransferase